MLRISPIPFNSQEALADGVETSARAVHLVPAWQRMGQVMLRISTEQNVVSLAIALEGRIAGPWVAALSQTWQESATSLGKRELLIDLRNTTDADAIGIRLLREIYSQTAARFLTGNPWTNVPCRRNHSRINNPDGRVVMRRRSGQASEVKPTVA